MTPPLYCSYTMTLGPDVVMGLKEWRYVADGLEVVE